MDWSLLFKSRYHIYGSLTLDTNWVGSRERSSSLGMELAYMEKWGKKKGGGERTEEKQSAAVQPTIKLQLLTA